VRDVQVIGGAAEVEPVGDGDEVAQLAQVQIHGPFQSGDAFKVSQPLKEVLDTRLDPWHLGAEFVASSTT
jgi:hypothetical protein